MPLQSNPASNMPDEFIRDAWYVAAWGEEITRAPLRRVLLGEPVVLYRCGDGTAVALADRCVHRAYPLSRGSLDGDAIVCGYHGFRFDSGGICTWVPGQSSVPKSARVRPYTLLERGPFVWIWMGDPDAADAALLPAQPFVLDPQWRYVKDMRTLAARYALVIDNLMDLSHETYIHAATIGSAEVAGTPITTETDGHVVRCYRHMEGVAAPSFYRASTGITGPIDRWQDIEFDAPSFYTLHIRIAEAGAPDERAFFSKVMYALTPETQHTTHDFWVISRRGPERALWMDQAHIASQNAVLMEDITALEALEANLPARGGWQELSINNDRGGLQWRRVFRERLARERAGHERDVLGKLEPLASV